MKKNVKTKENGVWPWWLWNEFAVLAGSGKKMRFLCTNVTYTYNSTKEKDIHMMGNEKRRNKIR